MRTSSRCISVVIVLCAVLAGCSLNPPGSGPTATPASSSPLSPAWSAVLNQIGPDGEVSLATALQAYTLVFGPLPGVQLPTSSAEGLIPSGTLAMRLILRHYRDLTPAQQQVVLQRLGYTAPPRAAAPSPGAAPLAAVSQALAHVLAPPLLAPAEPTPVPTDATGTASYRALIDAFIPKFNGFLGFTLPDPVTLAFDPSTKAGAYAENVDAQGGFIGAPTLCGIYLNPILNSYTLDDQRLFMGHELFHCYEAAIQGSVLVVDTSPDWLIEGAAEWAGALVSGAPAATKSLQGSWIGWLCCPDVVLFARAYSALGFYALLDQAGISPWSVLPAMLTSQNKGNNNLAAYQAATKPAPQAVLDAWASSYERDSGLGLFWDLTGPGIIAASSYGGPEIHAVTLANGGSQTTVTTMAYTAINYHLTSQADVLQVNISGTARLIDEAHVEHISSANGSYCTKSGGCTCPPGSPYQGPELAQLTGLVHLALTGGPNGVTGSVSGTTLQDFCSHATPTKATTALCTLVSTSEFGQAVGVSVAQVHGSAKTNPGDPSQVTVSCFYFDQANIERGAIFYLIVNNAAQYYATAKQSAIAQGDTGIKDISGLGDAAFVAMPPREPPDTMTVLLMRKGNLIASMIVPGDESSALTSEKQIALLIASRV